MHSIECTRQLMTSVFIRCRYKHILRVWAITEYFLCLYIEINDRRPERGAGSEHKGELHSASSPLLFN